MPSGGIWESIYWADCSALPFGYQLVIKCAGLEMRVKKVPRENINILDIDGTVIKTVILRSVAKEIENASRDREAESRNGDSITSSYEALQEEQKHSQHGAGGNEGICHTSAWDTIEKKVLPVGLDLLLRLL